MIEFRCAGTVSDPVIPGVGDDATMQFWANGQPVGAITAGTGDFNSWVDGQPNVREES